MKFGSFVAACAVAATALVGAASSANAVTYNFDNVALSDGGLLNGTLTIDFGGVFGYHLATTGGNAALDTTYVYPGFPSPSSIPFGAPTVVQLFPNSETAMLQLTFGSNLMAGGPVVLEGGSPGPSYECGGPGDFLCPFGLPGIQGLVRYVAADETTIFPTPLPATLPLFLSGSGVIGLLAWRRKRKAGLAA